MSAVIEQSIRDNFHRILQLHATSCRMIPGFAHLRIKEASHLYFYLKMIFYYLPFFVIYSKMEKKTKRGTQNRSPINAVSKSKLKGSQFWYADTILAHFIEFLPAIPCPQWLRAVTNHSNIGQGRRNVFWDGGLKTIFNSFLSMQRHLAIFNFGIYWCWYIVLM